jgi:hypothetical protein
LVLLHTILLASAESVAFPAAAEKALERYQQSGTRAFLAWKQAIEKERAILIKSLEGVLASESKKKGNEAVVQALTARIESLRRDDWVVETIKEQCAGSNDLLSANLSERAIPRKSHSRSSSTPSRRPSPCSIMIRCRRSSQTRPRSRNPSR